VLRIWIKKAMRNKPSVWLAMALILWPMAAIADLRLNMSRGVSPISREVYNLHMLILGICAVIALGVYVVMFYSIYAHRKSKGAVAAQFHENTTLEVLWTVIPVLILVAMAVPATRAMINMYNTADSAMTVKVTGYQWKWRYEYLDSGISFFSTLKTPNEQIYGNETKGENYLLEVDNPLVLPVNTKVRFVITAADVLHAWWVPDFGWKQDAIPGFINEGWVVIEKPGTYRGQCAELCGRGHGFMPVVVEAKSEEDYAKWVEEQKLKLAENQAAAAQTLSQEALMQKGQEIYNSTCASCHQAKGEGVPGVFPAIAGSAIAKGPVEGHLKIVIHGKEGTAMMPFGPQLNDRDIAAVVTYERNGLGNNVGDVVQPAQAKAAR
jgi:cytochrome c oxidase subunit II